MTTDPIPLRPPPEPPAAPDGGFVLSRILRLRFEDDDLAGLVVRARALSVAQLLEVTGLADAASEAGAAAEAGRGISPEQRSQIDRLFALFAARLVSWNVTDDDGRPVPATHDGVMGQDFDQVLRIVMEWIQAVAGVAAPLARRSTPGGNGSSGPDPQELMGLPMEPLPSPVS